MHVVRSALLLLRGEATGIVFMISCGDNWHLGADAAIDAPKTIDAAPVCDCPAVESPLAGRFVVASNVRTLPANGRLSEDIRCPAGMPLISGSCVVDNATMRFNVTLEQSGAEDVPPTTWGCAFHNYEPFPVSFRVSATCLKPAP